MSLRLIYNDHSELEKMGKLSNFAIEMETAALYTLAAKFVSKALSILTVSDHILTGEITTAQERQTTFNEMIEVGITAIKE